MLAFVGSIVVWLAIIRNKTTLDQMVEGRYQIPTIATKVLKGAVDGILGRELKIDFTL